MIKQHGLSLIELMSTVGIVGILTAIAYPSYTDHVLRSARVEATTALLDLVNKQEHFYAENQRYSDNFIDLALSSELTETGMYRITMTSQNDQDYTLTATPYNGISLDDEKCQSFMVNEIGQRDFSGSAIDKKECWGF